MLRNPLLPGRIAAPMSDLNTLRQPLQIEPLPTLDVRHLRERLRAGDRPCLLETAAPTTANGAPWHYFAAYPIATWKWNPGEGDPWEALDCWLAQWQGDLSAEGQALPPFVGGAVGYIAYEAGARAFGLGKRSSSAPDMHFQLYDELIAVEALTGRTLWLHRGRAGGGLRRWWEVETAPPAVPVSLRLEERPPRIEDDEYISSVKQLREGIGRGDYYEVNFCRRHTAQPVSEGVRPCDTFDIYERLRELQPVPYSALLPWEPVSVMSASPECFLSKRGRHVITRPIKGTAPRSGDLQRDRVAQAELLSSRKERAELAMIIDLQRNDLGRVAKGGTVRVVEEAALEEYSTVYHTVATVDAELRAGISFGELLRATFPGGSITGAPKIAAMHAIEQYERDPRHVYTGSVGWIGGNGDAELSIAIRTVLADEQGVHYSVGGAITWDSDAEAERRELAAKGKAIRAALGLEPE